MRKIVRSALTVAISIAALGGLYSCKDSNEDLIYEKTSELSQQLESLRNELLNNDTKIEDALQAQITGMNSLISTLQSQVADLQNQINNLKVGDGCNCSATISALNEQIIKINAAIEQLQADVEASKNAAGGLTSADVDKAIADAIAKNNEDLKNLYAEASALDALKEALAEQLAGYATTEDINNLKNSFYTKDEIDSLLAGLQTSITEAYNKAVEAYNLAYQAYLLAQQNSGNTGGSTGGGHGDDNTGTTETPTVDLTDIYNRLTDAENNLAEAKTLLQKEIADAKAEVLQKIEDAKKELSDSFDATIGDLKDAYEKADKELEQEIKDLTTRVETNEAAIEAIKNQLANLVTGVIVQGTFNTPLGTLSLPLNIQSNILCAYYGQAESDVEFPTMKASNLVDASQYLTKADFNILGFDTNDAVKIENGQMILEESEGNAGKVYLTVNPTGIDYKGLSIALENSKGEACPISLSPLTPCDEKLTFGYTGSRSEANGFYVANATVAKADLAKAKINIESGLKSAVKDLYQNKTSANLTNLASVVYKQFNGILDANAVKVTRADGNSLYSQYGVAAFAYKPLSYAFDPSFSYNIPTLNFTLPSLDDIKFDFNLGELDLDFGLNFNFDDLNFDLSDFNINITSITLDDIDLSGVNPEVKVSFSYDYPVFEEKEIDGEIILVVAKNEDGTDKTEKHYDDATVDLEDFMASLSEEMSDAIKQQITDALKDMTSELNQQIKDQLDNVILKQLKEKLNTVIAEQLNEQIESLATNINDQINDLLSDLTGSINNQISSTLGDYQSYLDKLQSVIDTFNSYINRINNLNIVNKINASLQGILVYQGNDGKFARVSTSKNLPSVFKIGTGNAIALHPTSLSAEILAPAYKKFVGVTNVWSNSDSSKSAQGGDAGCKAAAQKANSQQYFAKVVDGARYGVPFYATAGYTYEIVYSALDYQGKISQRKFYIKVL
jgi:hypothetical protein